MKTKFNSTTMKTMKNFAAQQLSKNQMNEVKGGLAYCSLLDTTTADFVNQDGFYVDMAAGDAKATIDKIYAGTGLVAICHDSLYH